MAYDLEEQEQIATLKAWWNQYGNLITWVVTAALLSFAGWSGWKYYQRDQSGKAAMLYEEIVKAGDAKDPAKVARAAEDIKDKFSGTPYAQMGALTAAKSAFDAGDMKAAKTHLQWVSITARARSSRRLPAYDWPACCSTKKPTMKASKC